MPARFLKMHRNELLELLLKYKNVPEDRRGLEAAWKNTVRDLPSADEVQKAADPSSDDSVNKILKKQHKAYSRMVLVAQALNYVDFITAQENQGPTGILADYFGMPTQFKDEAGVACALVKATAVPTLEQFGEASQSQYILTENALYYFDKIKNKLDVVLAPKDGETAKDAAAKAAALVGIAGILEANPILDNLSQQQQRIISHHLSKAGIGHAGIGHGRNLSYLNDWFEIKAPNITLKKSHREYGDEIWNDFRAAQKAHLIATSKIKYTETGEFDEEHSTFNFEGDFVPVPAEQCLSHIRAQGLGSYPDNFAVDRTKPDSKGRYPFNYAFGQYVSPGGGMVAIQKGSQAEDKQLIQMLNEHLEEEHGNLWMKAQHHYSKLEYNSIPSLLVVKVFNKYKESINKASNGDKSFIRQLQGIIEAGGNSREVRARLQDAIGLFLQNHPNAAAAKDLDLALNELLSVKEVLLGAEVLGKFTTSINKALGNNPEFISRLKEIIESGDNTTDVVSRLISEIDGFLQHSRLSLDAIKDIRSLRAAIQVETFALTPLYAEAIAFIKKDPKTGEPNFVTEDIPQHLDGRVFSGRQSSRTYFLNGDLVEWFQQSGRIPGELEYADDLAGSARKHLTLFELLARSREIKFSHIAIPMVDTEIRMEKGTWDSDEIWIKEQYALAQLMLSGENAMVVPLRRIIARIDQETNPEIKKSIEDFIYSLANISSEDRRRQFDALLIQRLNQVDSQLVSEWRTDRLVAFLNQATAEMQQEISERSRPMAPLASLVATLGIHATRRSAATAPSRDENEDEDKSENNIGSLI